jgi:hypothetical protein
MRGVLPSLRSIISNMDPGNSDRRAYNCSPRKERVRSHKTDRKVQRRERLRAPHVSDWRSSCLGYTRRYL